ncbi:hypothetical protein Riv7116_5684 [Rivularia sp. PCC 7116]|nr:hypothetical protein Riv7116_5684 [Rivularia sp. PCC 7116]
MEGKIQISETEKLNIFEQIGEASGRYGKIDAKAHELLETVFEEVIQSRDEWIETLGEKLELKSNEWESEYSGIWNREKLTQDYAYQFNQDLSEELDNWINEELKENILQKPLESLDITIQFELEKLNHEFKTLKTLQEQESDDLTLLDNNQNDLISISYNGFWGGFGAIGVGAALVPVVFIAGPVLAIIAGLGAGLFGAGMLEESVKEKVIELGFEKFNDSIDDIFEKLIEMIISLFGERVEMASTQIAQAISLYENLLEQQENAHQETIEQLLADKAWISQKRSELERIQQDMKSIIQVY